MQPLATAGVTGCNNCSVRVDASTRGRITLPLRLLAHCAARDQGSDNACRCQHRIWGSGTRRSSLPPHIAWSVCSIGHEDGSSPPSGDGYHRHRPFEDVQELPLPSLAQGKHSIFRASEPAPPGRNSCHAKWLRCMSSQSSPTVASSIARSVRIARIRSLPYSRIMGGRYHLNAASMTCRRGPTDQRDMCSHLIDGASPRSKNAQYAELVIGIDSRNQ